MKYYVMKYKYLHTASQKGNLGDNIQSFAVIDMLKRLGVGVGDIDYINRDELALKDPERKKGIFVVQGWCGCMPKQRTLPVNDYNIRPLYFGFHVNEGSWHKLEKDNAFKESLKKYEPIGCRDFGTRGFLRSLGVKAYFSGCLTMTFDVRKNTVHNGKLFLVDSYRELDEYIPERFKDKIVRLTQEDHSSDGYSPSGLWPMTDEDVKIVDQVAYNRLKMLKNEAAMVATCRIHVAMPCMAMGIPVVFSFHNKFDPRITALREVVPVYNKDNIEDLDWDIGPVDLSMIKKEMQLIFTYRLQEEEHKLGMMSHRLSKEDCKKAKVILEQLCVSDKMDMPYKTTSYEKNDVLKVAFGKRYKDVVAGKIPVVLFGAGSAGGIACTILSYCGITPLCFCDNSVKMDNITSIKNVPLITFETLKKEHNNSIVMITTKTYLDPIRTQLKENGFSIVNIIDSTPFLRKYIDFAVPGEQWI